MKYEEEREKIKKYNKKLINSVNYFIISLLKKKKKIKGVDNHLFFGCVFNSFSCPLIPTLLSSKLIFPVPGPTKNKKKGHFLCFWFSKIVHINYNNKHTNYYSSTVKIR